MAVVSGLKIVFETLKVLRFVSQMAHEPVADKSMFFIIIHAGLKPVNTKALSVLLFPV